MAESVPNLRSQMEAVRERVETDAPDILEGWGMTPASAGPSHLNLAHYIALRRIDLRPVQAQLMWRGLSSLGRLEGRVLPTLDAVIGALARLEGEEPPRPQPTEAAFYAGSRRLAAAGDQLFGKPPPNRHARIMVTLATAAASDPDYVMQLARAGMNVARINCAHDGTDAWRAMATHVKKAGKAVGRPIPVLMDIAGPKIRTGAVKSRDKKARLYVGDRFLLSVAEIGDLPKGMKYGARVSVPELVERLRPGDRVFYDDLKLRGRVESVLADGSAAAILVEGCREEGFKLKPEKGLNVPDTALGLSPLTSKDKDDLRTVLECGDMIGYSFVSRPDDLDLLEEALAEHPGRKRPLGLVAKIERPEAVLNLPGLIARALPHRPFGVMIARGDLAAEIGFERLAEMQEEILWICEAASVPVVWATQVLEGLVKEGVPSRGEMTDAAMAARAECIMLNKGASIVEAVEMLDRLISRMEGHMLKKTPRLRALKSW